MRPPGPAKSSRVPVWVWVVGTVAATVLICLGCAGYIGFQSRQDDPRPSSSRQLPAVTFTKCEISGQEAELAYTVVNTGPAGSFRFRVVVKDSAGLQVGSVQRRVEVEANAKVDESFGVTLDAAGGKTCEVVGLQ